MSYYSSGYDDAYAEALKKAVELARTKAEALAEASGRTLGYVVSIEEYSDSQYGRYVDGGVNLRKESVSMAAGAEDAAADMNVMPGEMEVSANIKIVFSMGKMTFAFRNRMSLPGFEPGAFRLGGEPSIQLRYRDIYVLSLIFDFSALCMECFSQRSDRLRCNRNGVKLVASKIVEKTSIPGLAFD